MRTEMIIRVQTSSEKGSYGKAIKVAAGIKGVESVTLAGEGKNLLLVIGVGIDSNRITKKLRQKVGHAEVVELRSVDAAAGEMAGLEHAYRYHPSPSPYNHHRTAPRENYYAAAGGGSYPAAGGQYYHPSLSTYKQQHAGGGSMYGPPTMAAGGRDYYYNGGYYPPAQYQHQQQNYYQPPPVDVHTVVHHDYANDPNSCSVM